MNDTVRPAPLELLQLRSATATYVAMLRDVDAWAEQAIDVNRIVRPKYAHRLDELRAQLQDAQMNGCIGSPAAIRLALVALLEEE